VIVTPLAQLRLQLQLQSLRDVLDVALDLPLAFPYFADYFVDQISKSHSVSICVDSGEIPSPLEFFQRSNSIGSTSLPSVIILGIMASQAWGSIRHSETTAVHSGFAGIHRVLLSDFSSVRPWICCQAIIHRWPVGGHNTVVRGFLWDDPIQRTGGPCPASEQVVGDDLPESRRVYGFGAVVECGCSGPRIRRRAGEQAWSCSRHQSPECWSVIPSSESSWLVHAWTHGGFSVSESWEYPGDWPLFQLTLVFDGE
jgi:hypothetical protein